jgi:hypothetical protein
MKKSALLICFLLFTFQTFAQVAKQAMKFDEFSYYPAQKSSPLIERGNRFARQMLKEAKTDRAVIIYYNQRMGEYPLNKGKDWAEYTAGIMVNGYNISRQRIFLIDGGHHEYATLEYWVVPQNAELPKPAPTVTKNELVICPEIRAAGDGFRRDRNKPLNFSVAVKGGAPDARLQFDWNVSAGKIIEGQGTNLIKIDLSQTDARKIGASVQVKGLAPECGNYAFASTEVGMFPYKFAEIQYNYSYLAALLDAMYISLRNEPELKGYIIFYGQRVGNSNEVKRSINTTRNYLNFRRFDLSRVSVIHGGFREEGAVEIYLIPEGVEPPKPTLTIDERFVTFTDKIKKGKTKRVN